MRNLTGDIANLVNETKETNYYMVLDKKKKQLIITLDVDVDKIIKDLESGFKQNVFWTRIKDVPQYDITKGDKHG